VTGCSAYRESGACYQERALLPSRKVLPMTGQPDDALEVLRGVWTAQGHTTADLDDGDVKACKRMAGVGFGVAGDDEDLRSAWRSRLEREGKLSMFGGSVADLVFSREGTSGEAPAR
jgi:hypothetical protein